MNNNILVLGGTGKTGRRVVGRLQKLGHSVRVGSRSEQPAFDWEKPEEWATVLEGIDKVYITFYPDLAVPDALQAIELLVRAAKRQGIQKLVLLSGRGEREAQLCEQVVIHSGVDYTIVRATWFNQNFSESFVLDPILMGDVKLPQSEVPIPFVDADDIAEVVVESLLSENHNGQIYELTGSRVLTFKDAIAEIAQASGRVIRFEAISLEGYASMLQSFGVPDDFIWLVNYLFTEVLGNEEASIISHDIEKVLGRPATDFSEYAAKVAATGIWNKMVSA